MNLVNTTVCRHRRLSPFTDQLKSLQVDTYTKIVHRILKETKSHLLVMTLIYHPIICWFLIVVRIIWKLIKWLIGKIKKVCDPVKKCQPAYPVDRNQITPKKIPFSLSLSLSLLLIRPLSSFFPRNDNYSTISFISLLYKKGNVTTM